MGAGTARGGRDSILPVTDGDGDGDGDGRLSAPECPSTMLRMVPLPMTRRFTGRIEGQSP